MAFFYVVSPSSVPIAEDADKEKERDKEIFNADCTVSILLNALELWYKGAKAKAEAIASGVSLEKSQNNLKKMPTKPKKNEAQAPPPKVEVVDVTQVNTDTSKQIVFDLFDGTGAPLLLSEHKNANAKDFIQSRQTYTANYRNPQDQQPPPQALVQPQGKQNAPGKVIKK
ncbi:MAG: hypothetical protein EZS28_024778 [Streblomastix strix]|uniref:Uncharacterized protein n=1 Tax=Streblomastix strix TaxID=222440 RepID=A0A5J4VB84_9EUKA|nr:MAG: hypothetical protein EZS28_024778 [Streblomastix strix]